MTISAPGGWRGIDPMSVIDTGRWSSRQKWTALLGGLAMVVDGFDNQLLGIAIPALAKAWGVAPAAFAPALTSGLVGMLVGNAIGGIVGDRIGRKPALITSMALFGLLTISVASIDTLPWLIACRFLSGIGLGATVPNASALVAETTPARRRTLIVTISTLGSPLGGVVAGLVASTMLSADSWRIMFVAGGLAPLVHICLSSFLLTESPQFLAARQENWPRLRAEMKRFGAVIPSDAALHHTSRTPRTNALARIFSSGWQRDTSLLWMVSVANMLALYMLLSWLPAMLTELGYTIAFASFALAAFNIGGIIGSIVAAKLTERIGSRWLMAALAFCAAVLGAGLAVSPLSREVPASILVLALCALGIAGGAFNVMLFPLALHVYPPEWRAGAFGAVLAIGRCGAAASPYFAVTMTQIAASHGFFGFYAALMLIAAAAVALLSRHIPASHSHVAPGE